MNRLGSLKDLWAFQSSPLAIPKASSGFQSQAASPTNQPETRWYPAGPRGRLGTTRAAWMVPWYPVGPGWYYAGFGHANLEPKL